MWTDGSKIESDSNPAGQKLGTNLVNNSMKNT